MARSAPRAGSALNSPWQRSDPTAVRMPGAMARGTNAAWRRRQQRRVGSGRRRRGALCGDDAPRQGARLLPVAVGLLPRCDDAGEPLDAARARDARRHHAHREAVVRRQLPARGRRRPLQRARAAPGTPSSERAALLPRGRAPCGGRPPAARARAQRQPSGPLAGVPAELPHSVLGGGGKAGSSKSPRQLYARR
jgi:hypothetical protein